MRLLYTTLLLLVCLSAAAVINVNDSVITQAQLVTCADGKQWSHCAPGNELITPTLIISDVVSAPDNGWSTAEPNKGAAVTIWGRNLGDTRGASYVTVNGVNLTASTDYPDTWGEYNDPVPWLQRITFHLNSSMTDGTGSITVTTAGGTSNALPFSIHDGDIYFVDGAASGAGTGTLTDPWQNAVSFVDVGQAGDVLYWRGGTYDQQYDSGHANYYMGGTSPWPTGTESQPVAYMGYPGETVIFDSKHNGDTSPDSGFSGTQAYSSFSRFSFNSYHAAVGVSDYNRVVGNDMIGLEAVDSGNGVIDMSGNGILAAANAVHGIRSGNKLDHGIYVKGCPDVQGATVMHNYIYDNDTGNGQSIAGESGALIVVNHQDNRCPDVPNVAVQQHIIESNYIDCIAFNSRAIGVYHQSSSSTDATQNPEPTIIRNNLANACAGNNYSGAFYSSAYDTEWYNNACIDCKYELFSIGGSRVNRAIARNNIFTMSGTGDYEDHVAPPTFDYSHNLFYGNGAYSGLSTNTLNVDPLLIIDLTGAFEMYLAPTSQALDAGVAVPITTDFFYNSESTPFNIGPVGVQ